MVEDCFASAEGVTPDCIGAAAATCQAGPGGGTTFGIVACLTAETAIWDAILNREYGALRADLSAAADDGPLDPVAALTHAQRAWIAFRDAECTLAHAIWQGGTIRSVMAADCALRLTATRTIALAEMRAPL